MAAIEHQPLASTYSVEVSGWDYSHAFFVERCGMLLLPVSPTEAKQKEKES